MTVLKKTHSLIFSVFLLFTTTITAHAADATFSWTPNSDQVSGYKIHYGTSSRSYTLVTDVGLPTAIDGRIVATVHELAEGQTYYFAATAYSGNVQSDFSVEVVHTVPTTTQIQPPSAGNISLQGSEDTPLSGQLSVNNSGGSALTFTVVAQPGHGTLSVIDSAGSFTYTPAANYWGEDSFIYTATNSAGASNQATVSIHLASINDAPVAKAASFSTNEDIAYSGQLTATDIDSSSVTYSRVSQAGNGSVNISADGRFTYTPNQDFSGSDSFTFKVSDGTSTSNTATINVTVTPVNDAPVAKAASFSTNEDIAYSGQLTATDIDSSSVTYSRVSQAGNGSVNISADGRFTYTPNQDFSGSDSFTFKVSDGTSTSNTATINVTVTPVNDAPVAKAASFSTNEDIAYSGQLTATDIDSSSITYSRVSQAGNGSVNISADGRFTYTPNQDFSGSDSFTFKVSDGTSTSNTATINVTVTPVNDAPVAKAASFSTNEDIAYSGQLTATDIDSSSITYSRVSQAGNGSVNISADGRFTYTPNQDFSGSDSFTFKVSDGTSTSNTATINVTVTPVNDAPVAKAASFSTNEDIAYSGQLTATDIDSSSITYSRVSQAGNGSVNISADGRFTYTPNQDFSGSDSFTFKVSDGTSTSNTAVVTITIHHINIAPVAKNSGFSIDQGAPYQGGLIATDENGDALHFFIVTAPTKGTLDVADDGSFTYTPNADALEADQFTFLAKDGELTSNIGTVTILINEVSNELAFELGELLVTSDWKHVNFSTEYTSPAVIAKSTTMNTSEAGAVSIRNMTSKGFDIRIREWNNADGIDPEEIVSFMVMERGHHKIADNVYAAAECTSLTGLNTYQSIHFTNSFSSQPVILSSLVTENETDVTALRMKDITNQGFAITMQEQELNNGVHTEETMCYIAMEKWTGIVDGLMVEVGATEKILTDKISTVSFKQQFPTIPFILADMQSTDGLDTATIGMSDLSISNAGMTILEEQSADIEMNHTAEIGGYIAVTPYNPEEDSDHDSLTNEEELIIHTHPGLWDTDQDGINDGNEYDHWATLGMNPEVDSDGDGKANLQDNDSDNDGFPDGVEILKGFNPTDRLSLPSFTFEVGELTVGTTPVWISFKNSYIEPGIITNTVIDNNTTQDIIQISNVTADGCNIQLQENAYLANSQNVKKVSFIVTENYQATEIVTPDPIEEPQVTPDPVEEPQVTPEPVEEPQVTSRRFNVKSLSSLVSLFNEMMEGLLNSRKTR